MGCLMDNYFNSLYQVLKAVEYSSYSGEKIDDILNLKKLKLTEKELNIITYNILNEGLAVNRTIQVEVFGNPPVTNKFISPQLTTKGYEYLQDNTKMKQAFKVLKELKEWIPGFFFFFFKKKCLTVK